jgi:hypothetical protein
MLEKIESILKQMDSISLEEMREVCLMDRVDSKFVAPLSFLPALLEEAKPYFRVQINDNGALLAPYTTQYLDTPCLDMFTMHHNGKLNRQKIRIRSYVDAALSFLEVKNKNNKGRTKKIRVPVNHAHVESVNDLTNEKGFLVENSLFETDALIPSLANDFKRITLVNSRKTERITIDVDLSFHNYFSDKKKSLDNLMILELKQDGWQHSDFRDILMKLRIKQGSFSKYCMGIFLTDPNVKYNRFRRRWNLINKLTQ